MFRLLLGLSSLLTVLSITFAKTSSQQWCNSTVVLTECRNITVSKPLRIPDCKATLQLFPPLEEIPSRLFVALPQVRSLIITHTMVKRVHADSFAGLAELRSLDLFWNEISFLPADIFQQTVKLQDLNLGGNDLTYIESSVFRNLDHLDVLNLANNWFTHVPNIGRLPSVTVLNLSHNNITRLDEREFAGVPALRELNLKGNVIEVIARKAFEGLNMLATLNIESNKLRDVNVDDIMACLPDLQSVRLRANDFRCETLQLIIEKLQAHDVAVPEGFAEPGPISYHGIFCMPASVDRQISETFNHL